jgi:hypothetical protein
MWEPLLYSPKGLEYFGQMDFWWLGYGKKVTEDGMRDMNSKNSHTVLCFDGMSFSD